MRIEDSNGDLKGLVVEKKDRKISNALFEISSGVTLFKQDSQ